MTQVSSMWNTDMPVLQQVNTQSQNFIGDYHTIMKDPVSIKPVPLLGPEDFKKEKEDFKTWLSHNNIPFEENNDFLFFRYNKKFCLYFEPYFRNNLFYLSKILLSYDIKWLNKTVTYLEVKNFEKPYIYTAEKIYEMVKSLSQRYCSIFYKNLSLDDIFYLPDINEYFILTKKNSIWYGYNPNEITIHWINLFHGKSIYTFKGNEINSYEEIKILGGSYGKNTSW
ncbi:hypothetical protein [Fusobacterium ulcerans]